MIPVITASNNFIFSSSILSSLHVYLSLPSLSIPPSFSSTFTVPAPHDRVYLHQPLLSRWLLCCPVLSCQQHCWAHECTLAAKSSTTLRKALTCITLYMYIIVQYMYYCTSKFAVDPHISKL